MVRRRSTKRSIAAKRKPRHPDRKHSKIVRWNKSSDVPLDEEDEFHLSRDRILLDGNPDDDDEKDLNDEEVFALKGVPQSSSEDDDHMDLLSDTEQTSLGDEPRAKKSKSRKKERAVQSSSPEDEEDEDEDESWGKKRSTYYSSNAAQLDLDDEEANELEEKEALRLQSKTVATLRDEDFGLLDEVSSAPGDDIPQDSAPRRSIAETLPQDKPALIRHVEKTNPETLALACDWDDVVEQLMTLEKKRSDDVAAAVSKDESLKTVHHQTLLTYVTTLAFYFYLRASDKYAQKPELLRSHPITPRLLMLKQGLNTLEMLDFDASDDDSELEENILDWRDGILDDEAELELLGQRTGLDPGELKGLLREANFDNALPTLSVKLEKRTKNGQKKKAALTVEEEDNTSPSAPAAPEPPKKKRKRSNLSATLIPEFDLLEPVFSHAASEGRSATHAPNGMDLDAFGESTALQHADASDKIARRKTLRFHTSKIESTSARRQGARNAMGGDDDIPYRERRKEKQQKQLQATKARAARGDDLDEDEPEANKKRASDIDIDMDSEGGGVGAGENGYYDRASRRSKAKKEKKKADYEAKQEADKPTFEEDIADGPRSLTRAILKNKGLTPHRSKSVRNPRVKKRERFEKAKKKLASQKAIYKGGDSSQYGGEQTGISRVVKSVRF